MMDFSAAPARLLKPLAHDLGLKCSVVFSSECELGEADSVVYDIHSTKLQRSVIIKEQRTSEGRAIQIGQEVYMALLGQGVDPAGFGLSQGALLPLCSSQVGGCARFVYQHGGTSLQELVDSNTLSMAERRAIMPWVAASMVATLAQLDEKCVVHRDFKLDNIVLDSLTNRVRLIDWGCAIPYHTPTFCGTPGCWPHECFQLVGEPGEEVPAMEEPSLVTLAPYFRSTYDVWCLGLALLKLWGCCLPSHLGRYSTGAWHRWGAGDWEQLLMQQIPDHSEVREFFMALLQPDPDCRPSASELLDHPLIKDQVDKVHQQWEESLESDFAERAATAQIGKYVLLLREAGVAMPVVIDKRNMLRFDNDYGVTAESVSTTASISTASGSDVVDSSSVARDSSGDAADESSEGAEKVSSDADTSSSDESDVATPHWQADSSNAMPDQQQQLQHAPLQQQQQQQHAPLQQQQQHAPLQQQQQQQQPVYWASEWQQRLLQRNRAVPQQAEAVTGAVPETGAQSGAEAEAWPWTVGLHESEGGPGAWVWREAGAGTEVGTEVGVGSGSEATGCEEEAWAWTSVLDGDESVAGGDPWAWSGAGVSEADVEVLAEQQQQQGPSRSGKRRWLRALAAAAVKVACWAALLRP